MRRRVAAHHEPGRRPAHVHGDRDRLRRHRLRHGHLDDDSRAREYRAPVLSGPAQPGWAQTGTDGTWKGTPAPTFAYQWADCDAAGANCTSIAGANLSSYWPVSSDFGSTLELTVTATNSAGSQSATSAPSAVITAPPSYSALPLITGTLAVDQTLSSDGGTWTGYPTPTLTYQWERCTTDFMHMCSPIAGASTSSYQLTGADLGQGMQVQVSATNSAGVRLGFRAPTGPVTPAPPAPPDAGTTSVSDLVVQGGVATFTFHGTVNPNANAAVSYGYSWGTASPLHDRRRPLRPLHRQQPDRGRACRQPARARHLHSDPVAGKAPWQHVKDPGPRALGGASPCSPSRTRRAVPAAASARRCRGL